MSLVVLWTRGPSNFDLNAQGAASHAEAVASANNPSIATAPNFLSLHTTVFDYLLNSSAYAYVLTRVIRLFLLNLENGATVLPVPHAC